MFKFNIQGILRKKIYLLPIIVRKMKNSNNNVYDEYNYLFENLRKKYSEKKPSEIELFRDARNLFRNAGIDPTKTRPASEALIRRVLKNKEIWSVNSAVDMGNICSIESGLPVLTYDIQKIKGYNISVRIGKENESYEGIGRRGFSLKGKPILVDKNGPFGCPVSDSVRTSVSIDTKKMLFIFVAPSDYDKKLLFIHGLKAVDRFSACCGGVAEIFPPIK